MDLWINAGLATLALTLFLMPFPRSWSLYSLGAFLFFGLVLWISDYSRIIKRLQEKYTGVLPLIIYFFLFLVGSFVFKTGWYLIEGNLMFIMIPVLGFPVFISDKFIDKRNLILKIFIYGLLIICAFEYLRALWNSISVIEGSLRFNYLLDPITSRFRSDQLSFMEHPTYLSLKVLMAIALLIVMRNDLNSSKAEIIIEVILLLLFIFSLSSRTGLVITFFLVSYYVYKLLKNKRKLYFLLLLIPIIAFALFKISSINVRINNRTEPVWNRYKQGELKIKDIDPRFTSWFTAWDLIKKNPLFGVGTNSRNILAAEYERTGYHTEASFRLNAHNQFLETQLAFGIPGSLVLLWMLLLPIIRRKRYWNHELIAPFLIIVITSMLFESILVRQWGIMFFVLFYCLLTISDKTNTSIGGT